MAVLLNPRYRSLDRGSERVMDEKRIHPSSFFDVLKYGGHPYKHGMVDTVYNGDSIGQYVPRMAGGAVTSLRSNSQPAGGVTDQQPITPAGEITSADIAAMVDQLTPTAARFRQQSSLLKVILERKNYTMQGDDQTARFANVGLGYLVLSHHHIAVSLVNAAVGAQVVKLSCFAPFNFLNNSIIAVNGGAATYNATATGGLLVAARSKSSMLLPTTRGGMGEGLSPALCTMTLDANATFHAAPVGTFPLAFTGADQISVAGASTAVVTFDFMTFEKVVLDFESGLGALPLQNNSTYATLERILAASFLGTNNKFPFYVAGAVPGTLTVGTVTGYSEGLYEFASVPADVSLYQQMVANSYQVQTQRNVTFSATGSQAFAYPIPVNNYMLAAHLLGTDSTGAPLDSRAITSAFSALQLDYNGGSIIPVIQRPWTDRAEKFMNYQDDRHSDIGGYFSYDGEMTANSLTATDEMGWINTYDAASPTIHADVLSTVSTPGVVDVTREQVVAGSVQVVGG